MTDGATYEAKPDSYYGRPILKAPVWTWEIPVYFFFGGMAGAAAPFAAVAEMRGDRALAGRAWLVALTGVGVSPLLLISDLGRPERFHHMLRVLKPTSPMNIGSWILSASGTIIALATARSVLGWFPRLGRVAPAVAVLGPALSTYTGVLVADTAVPAWHEARHELPWVFAAGSAMSAGAAVALTGGGAPARRLALAGAAGELAATTLMERRLGPLGEPYHQGTAGHFARASKALIVAGAAVMARAGRRRSGATAGAALLLAGALATRWSVYKAGFQSAADPKYVVEPQKAGR
ncbi:MAG TPA: NrfD/PsrC family molybdoenzyme membrane anchor subunit [Solirubrobacteraceae bacterium]